MSPKTSEISSARRHQTRALRPFARLVKASLAGLTMVVLTVPAQAAAGSIGSARITAVTTHAYGVVFVNFERPLESTPSCNTSGRFAISVHTPEGRTMAATAMLAKATGSPVTAVGWGTPTCGIWPDAEDMQFLAVN